MRITAEDLKELGISSFGHRRRLLNAIAALGESPRRVMWLQSATDADKRIARLALTPRSSAMAVT